MREAARLAREAWSMGRLFFTVSVCSFCFFVLLGFAGVLQEKTQPAAMPAMKGIASQLSSNFFMDMLSMEIVHLQRAGESSSFSAKNTVHFLLHYMTNINLRDPKSLLAGEIPGMRRNTTTLLYSGMATQRNDYPADFTPPAAVFETDHHVGTLPSRPLSPAPGAVEREPTSAAEAPARTTGGKKVVLIYHTHNRESFLPELPGIKNPEMAYHSEMNITLVGKRLSDKLEQLGIGSTHSDIDYPTTAENFHYSNSYTYSSQTVREAFAANPDLKLVFDVHRDALDRPRTTVTIDGTDYAQIYFVVGKQNPFWQRNSDFAHSIHTKLEERYPGISRGIFGVSSHSNSEFNQSLSPNSMLIEIGGPDNSLEEMYRTADLLAAVIADIYWQMEKSPATIVAMQ